MRVRSSSLKRKTGIRGHYGQSKPKLRPSLKLKRSVVLSTDLGDHRIHSFDAGITCPGPVRIKGGDTSVDRNSLSRPHSSKGAALFTTTVREQNPRSHHKGPTSRVRTGDQEYPVLCLFISKLEIVKFQQRKIAPITTLERFIKTDDESTRFAEAE